MHKKILTVASVLLFVSSVFVLLTSVSNSKSNEKAEEKMHSTSDAVFLIEDVEVQVELAQTQQEKSKGLSGRSMLPAGTGMFFIMDSPELHSFWMPDMNFPIDIIWMNEGMRVVDISHTVRPETYPKKFQPSTPALYVLEVPAGYAEKVGIQKGSKGVLHIAE